VVYKPADEEKKKTLNSGSVQVAVEAESGPAPNRPKYAKSLTEVVL